MFDTILIANRGEIACRIMDTAQRMGVRCVAVYSDADAQAKHVAMADRAVHIGGPAPADSYLRGDAIIAAALETGAEAIHPGYGFLSENPDFVDAVEAAGLTFIGPSASAIRAMGLK
ncbi:MAG: biotin carboxylase N-terminal domain-containing protein, partial [Pseudomonadota bacterium]